MTSTTAHPGHHHSTTKLALALAGATVAVGAGYGIAALAFEDPLPAVPTPPAQLDTRDNGSGFRGVPGHQPFRGIPGHQP